jgi:hypothetical protein
MTNASLVPGAYCLSDLPPNQLYPVLTAMLIEAPRCKKPRALVLGVSGPARPERLELPTF